VVSPQTKTTAGCPGKTPSQHATHNPTHQIEQTNFDLQLNPMSAMELIAAPPIVDRNGKCRVTAVDARLTILKYTSPGSAQANVLWLLRLFSGYIITHH
jgi:hypothetical protein